MLVFYFWFCFVLCVCFAWFPWTSWSVVWYLSLVLKSLDYYFFKYFAFLFSSLVFCLNKCYIFWYHPMVLGCSECLLLFIFWLLFFFSVSILLWGFSFDWSSNSLIFYLTVLSLLMRLLKAFFIPVTVIYFFFNFYYFLLILSYIFFLYAYINYLLFHISSFPLQTLTYLMIY